MGGYQRFSVEWLPLSLLETHPRVQRKFDEAWARKIAANFDPDEVGTLSVLKVLMRGKVHYWVFDGQHRKWAASESLGADQKVPCNVHEGLSDEECAKRAHGLNNRKSWRAIDSFVNRIRFDTTAQDINRIIQKCGLKVSDQPAPGTVRAVVACEWLYKKCSAEALERALRVLKGCWGSHYEALDQSMIRGMGLFLEKHGAEIDEKHLLRRLTAHGNPVRFLGHARELSKVTHKSLPRAIVEILREEYNKKLRNGRLDA